jgi:hypothetical protein
MASVAAADLLPSAMNAGELACSLTQHSSRWSDRGSYSGSSTIFGASLLSDATDMTCYHDVHKEEGGIKGFVLLLNDMMWHTLTEKEFKRHLRRPGEKTFTTRDIAFVFSVTLICCCLIDQVRLSACL